MSYDNNKIINLGQLKASAQKIKGRDIFDYLDDFATTDNGAGLHNSIYRGKNLGATLTADQIARITDRTFKGLWLGDYWTKSITFTIYDDQNEDVEKSVTVSAIMSIVDHDYYRYSGDDPQLTTPHLVVMPDFPFFSAPMNMTNTTEGAYVLSKMRTVYLAGAENAFNTFFGSDHLISYRDYLQNAVTDGRATAGAWYDCKVELMDESQAYGGLVFDSGASVGTAIYNRYSVSTKQFALFRVRPDLISKRQYVWLRNVVSSAGFALVSNRGLANYSYASPRRGVRPFALIH